MEKKRHTADEIVAKLRQVDVLMAQGRPVADAVQTFSVRTAMNRAVERLVENHSRLASPLPSRSAWIKL